MEFIIRDKICKKSLLGQPRPSKGRSVLCKNDYYYYRPRSVPCLKPGAQKQYFPVGGLTQSTEWRGGLIPLPRIVYIQPRYLFTFNPNIGLHFIQIFVISTQILVNIQPRYLLTFNPDICLHSTQIVDYICNTVIQYQVKNLLHSKLKQCTAI